VNRCACRALLLGAVVAVALASVSATARAYHTKQERATDDTAYTMEGGSLRAGMFKLQFSPLDFATVGTYTLPWAMLAATAHAKLRLLPSDPIAVALQAGFGYFDSSRLGWLDDRAGDAVVTVVPIEAFVSHRMTDLTLSGGVAYTEVGVDGAIALDAFDGAVAGATDNLQLTATFEVRLSRVIALLVHARWLVLQRVLAQADATVYPDDFTTVAVHSDVSGSRFEASDGFSVVPAVHFSWGELNLRAGLGYGNYNVPLVNFVLPDRTLIPDFDLFFVF
jgi:hypothetical protein